MTSSSDIPKSDDLPRYRYEIGLAGHVIVAADGMDIAARVRQAVEAALVDIPAVVSVDKLVVGWPRHRNDLDHALASSHGMIPGSHERAGGPECRCGAAWSRWDDRCSTQGDALSTSYPTGEGS